MGKQILFNTKMVQALLDGKKTTTRRIIKRTPSNEEPCGYGFWKDFNYTDKRWYIKDYTHSPVWWTLEEYISKFSKYHVGDILYVRETWLAHSRGINTLSVKYRADDAVNELVSFTKERFNKFYKFADQEKWQPSLFMPLEAARIFLKVTDVRIERLHDITTTDATKEGFKDDDKFNDKGELLTSLGNFSRLWDTTIKKDQFKMYSWDSNPYVWVIEFEIIQNV